MSAQENPTPATRRRRRRKHRASGDGMRWLWITLGSLAVLAVAGWLCLSAWVKSYVQSEKFRRMASDRLSDLTNADVVLESVQWQGSSAYVNRATASGRANAAFARAEVHDIRTTVDTGAIWDRLIKVDSIRIARVMLDLSAPVPAGAEINAEPSAPAPAAESGGGFFSRFLPNRTVVKGVTVDQCGLTWKTGTRFVEGGGIALQVKPADDNSFFLATGHGGSLQTSLLPGEPLKLRNFAATLQSGEVTLEELAAETAGASLTATGSLTTGTPATLTLDGTVEQLDLARLVPEDWVKSVQGRASGTVQITGDPADFARLRWNGTAKVDGGVLEGLPVLTVIARKTRNEGFVRLALRDARTVFTRTADGAWMLDQVLLDTPGLLRLKGRVTIGADESLHGDLLLGIVPGTLRYVAGAEQEVFQPLDKLIVTAAERRLITSDDAALLWTRLTLRGTLDAPQEDLGDRLARAWFNATLDEVLQMSPEAALRAAETAGKLATDAAAAALEKAPEMLDQGTDILKQGAEAGADLLEKGAGEGIRAIEGLLPR
jgi:hypothetical protein